LTTQTPQPPTPSSGRFAFCAASATA
jgi:hypothetical protein